MKTIMSIAAALALLASPAYAVSNENTDIYALREDFKAAMADAAPHAGEIWTVCDSWFMACTFSDPSGNTATCQGYVPVHWAAYVWLAAPSVVDVGPGSHTTWTQGHAGLGYGGGHNSGNIVGTTCFEDFFGLFYTYSDGAGTFA